jgi:2,3-bisphosphoglycerate-independent phosphoglycerate mutase
MIPADEAQEPLAEYALIFFMDGVGLGDGDPAVNPFLTAAMPHLTGLIGPNWFLRREPLYAARASLVPTDAGLGVPGRPQSATGQATILTGKNVSQLVGEHYGPKPNATVASIIEQGTLFHEVVAQGDRAALLTPYPQGYFDSIDSGRRIYSAVPLAAVHAGLSLMTADDLRTGRAVSPDFTATGWRDYLGYQDVPVLTPAEAGEQIAQLARQYRFSFFEHWPSDRAGHRGSLTQAANHLSLIDAVLGGLLAHWEDEKGLLLITSDHGNIEEKNQRQHTLNPVPTILVGPAHAQLAAQIHDLTDLAAVIRRALNL